MKETILQMLKKFFPEQNFAFGTDFLYLPDEDTVFLPERYKNDNDSVIADLVFHRDCCARSSICENYCIPLLSVLHELGHAFDEDMEDDTDQRNDLADWCLDADYEDVCIEYEKLRNEVVATDWAIGYLEAHQEEMQILNKYLLTYYTIYVIM